MTTIPAELRQLRAVIIALLVLASLISSPFQTIAQTPVTSKETLYTYDPNDLLAIKPELREKIAANLPTGLTEYDIAVTFPDEGAGTTLTGSQVITYTNTTGETLTDLPFRLYANSVADGNNAVIIDRVAVNDQPATVTLTVDNSVATVALPTPLAPNEQTRLDMEFTTRLDQDDPRHYGIFNFASESETWSVAHWYPVVAGRDPETGWMLKPTSIYGDPIFTDTGLYTVTITRPNDLGLITSGVEIDSETTGDTTKTTFNAWPSRDFVIIADADMQEISIEVNGTTVRSWFEPGHEAGGKAALTWSARALGLFNKLLAEYPYLQFQVVDVRIINAAGVEFPQLISIDRGYYQGAVDTTRPGYFEFTVAHEVVHQWFYNLVGNNQYDHAFIDESMTNYLSAQTYFEEFWGQDQADDIVQRNLVRPFVNSVENSTDPIVDFPTDEFPTGSSYVTAVYNKGPLGFRAINEAMGDDAFFAALQSYVHDFSFRVATPDDLLAAFESTSDVAIRPIWVHWFLERNSALDVPR